MDGALEPQEDLLGFQQSWISYFFGPRTSSVGLETKIAPTNIEQKLMKIAKCLGRAIDQTTYHGQILLKE